MVAAAWELRDRFFPFGLLRQRPSAHKGSEPFANLAAIRTAESRYFEKYGAYVSASPTPPEIPGPDRVPWPLGPEALHGFNSLDWAPEGAVRCQYGVSADGSAFTAEALCRYDDSIAAWGYVQPAPGKSRGIPGPLGRCRTLGVYDARAPGSYRLEQVGPCDEKSANLRY